MTGKEFTEMKKRQEIEHCYRQRSRQQRDALPAQTELATPEALRASSFSSPGDVHKQP